MAGNHKYGEINYNVKFTPDKTSLQSIQKELQAIQNMTTSQFQLINPNASKDTKQAMNELIEIKKEAAQVETALSKAMNVNLGTVNISKFRNEFSKINIDQLHTQLSKIGPVGAKAFNDITSSLLAGNIQIRQSHKLLDDMANSFKNTVKWGISSSIWNNMSGSIQKAWSYTKNLDSSLNDIRIVAGKSADEMERFAKQANNAAKTLGSSTLDYTNASLIYYQQGLSDEEVIQRTDTTVKMANVLGTSAKEVSNYMTAIWNNYAEGAANLEYFADVITALGANTASSAEEISDGLEKFAAIGDTVGLSYEYATSALATVVATTRQSADTVGTAFKTLFARIQGLKLGETLDDGTTLNKYSEALQAVGISIKDQNGELKAMDKILDEMGSKWGTLSKDQQVALAQTVAGTRQYSQLVALMDNWDTFGKNLNIASNATGTLQKQQAIYMESTEAHLEKLGASTERLMASLFDKDSVNGLIDGLSNVTTFVANFIESLGGGKNALLMLGSVGMQVFDTQIAKSISATISNIKNARLATQNYANDIEMLNNLQKTKAGKNDPAAKAMIDAAKEIVPYRDMMDSGQIEESNNLIKQIGEVAQLKKEWEEAKLKAFEYLSLLNSYNEDFGVNPKTQEKGYVTDEDILQSMDQVHKIGSYADQIHQQYEDFQKEFEKIALTPQETLEKNLDKYNEKFKLWASDIYSKLHEIKDESGDLIDSEKLENALNKSKNITQKKVWISDNKSTPEIDFRISPNTKEQFKNFKASLDALFKDIQMKTESISEYAGKEFFQVTSHTQELEDASAKLQNKLELLKNTYVAISEIKAFTNMVAGIGQLTSGISSLININNILKNDSISTGEKILQVITNLSTSIPIAVNGMKTMVDSGRSIIEVLQKQVYLTLQNTVAEGKEAAATLAKIGTKEAEKLTEEQLIALRAKENAGQAASIALDGVESASNLGLATTFGAVAASIWAALAPLLPFIAAIGAVAVGIAALVKAYNADADAAKAAAESVQTLSKRYAECQQAADDLKESITGYQEAIDQMKDLKVGTEEYESALKKANEEAKKLIEQYKLFGQYTYKNGVITIDEQALQNAQTKANAKANQLANELANAEIYANQANIKSKGTDLSRNIGQLGTGRYRRVEDTQRSQVGRTEYKEEEIKESLSQKELENVVSALGDFDSVIWEDTDALKESILASDKVSDLAKKNADEILKNTEELKTFAETIHEAAEANKYYAEQIMSNIVEDKYGDKINKMVTEKDKEGKDVINEQRAAQINAIATQWATKDTNAMNKKLEGLNKDVEKVTSNGKLNDYLKEQGASYSIDNDKDLALTYATEVLGHKRNELTYKGGWNKGTVRDKEGNAVVDQVSDDVMRREIAKAAATKKITEDYSDKLDQTALLDNLNTAMEGMKELGSKYGTDFTDAFLNAATSKDKTLKLDDLYAYLNPDAIEELGSMDGQQWLDKMGLTESQLKNMGFKSANDFAKQFQEGLENYKWDASKALDAAVTTDDEAKIESHDLKVDEVKDYSKYLMETAEAAEELDDELRHDAEAATIVSQSIMRMNRGIDKLADGFKDWKDILTKSEKSSEEYYDALTNMKDAVADLLDTEDEYVTDSFIQDHLNDIQKAAEGDSKAIDKLHKELAKDIVLNIAVNNQADFDDIDIESLKEKINSLEIPDVKVGSSMDFTEMDSDMQEFTRKMVEIVNNAHMTADEANAFFGQMGFEAKFDTKKETVTRSVPVETTESEITSIFPLKMTSRTYQSGTESVTQEVDVPAMTTDGSDPKVTLTKKAGGNFNNYSSKNKGGGGPGKSGGGDSKPDKMDHITSDPDRYHKVDTQLTKVGNKLSMVQSQTEKAFGTKAIDNYNSQLKLLQAQIDLTTDKIRIAREEQAELQAKLAGAGVQFSRDGTVSNYMEIIKSQEAYVNSLVDRYNSMSKEEQESYKETVEKAKEDFDKLQSDLDRYDELISDFIPGLQQDIQDAIDEKIQISIDKFNYELKITLDLSDAERSWNEFKKKYIEDMRNVTLGDVEILRDNFSTYYDQDNASSIQVTTRKLNEALAELAKQNADQENLYGDNQTAALDDIREKYEQLMEDIAAVKDLQDEAHQDLMAQMDEANEELQKQIGYYDKIASQLEHNIKLIQLVYGEKAFDQMDKWYEQRHRNNIEELDFLRQQRDLWYNQMMSFEEGSDEWENARDKWLDALESLNSKIEETIEQAREKFENALDSIFEKLNDKVTGGLGLDYTTEQWDLINKNAEQYLDKINALQGIREIEKKYVDAINSSSVTTTQQKLKKIMDEELEDLRSRDKLTQYDIERAEKKYNLMLAQIALEEAQQNKSSARLRRDSQGNYRYVFTADDDAIAAAQDDLAVAQNDLYNFDKEHYLDNLQQALDAWTEYQEKMHEAALINDPQERAERELLIQEEYGQLINGLTEQNALIRQNLYESAYQDLALLEETEFEVFKQINAGKEDIILGSLIPQWDSGVQHMIDVFSGEGGFEPTTIASMEAIEQATLEYEEELKEVELAGDTTFETIADGTDKNIELLQHLITENENLINKQNDEIEKVKDVVKQIDRMAAAYKQAGKDAEEAAEKAFKAWSKLQEQAAAAGKAAGTDSNLNNTSTSSNSNNRNNGSGSGAGNGSGGGAGAGGDGVISVGDMVTYIGGGYTADSYGGGATGNRGPGGQAKVTQYLKGRPRPVHLYSTNSAYGWVREDQISGYDTGGYTGDWGSKNGRLAMLHQKELVLNAQDTENMLNAVGIMRDITRSIGVAVLSRLAGVTATGNTGNLGAAALEQNVNIQAEFPNVTNSREIEDALNNLVNVASQRIHEDR